MLFLNPFADFVIGMLILGIPKGIYGLVRKEVWVHGHKYSGREAVAPAIAHIAMGSFLPILILSFPLAAAIHWDYIQPILVMLAAFIGAGAIVYSYHQGKGKK